MDLLNSLLDALVRLQGDALVMHAGEKPYVVTTSPGMHVRGARAWGQVELSSGVLTPDLVSAMASRILPAAQRHALDELGAIEHEIPPPAGVSDRFTVVAARGGDDIWLEVRRQAVGRPGSGAVRTERAEEPSDIFEQRVSASAESTAAGRRAAGEAAEASPPAAEAQPPPTDEAADAMLTASASAMLASVNDAVKPPFRSTPVTESTSVQPSVALDIDEHGTLDQDRAKRPADRRRRVAEAPGAPAEASLPDSAIGSLLRSAAARGASMVYAVAGARPMAHIKGDFAVLEGLPALSAEQLEQMLQSLPALEDEATAEAGRGEWVSDVPEVGRVRCMRFRDHRGPGAIFRLVLASTISAEQLRLPEEIRDLCSTDGVVIVSGAPGSGKSTLMHGIVDLINRMRSDHVITVEPRIHFVHSNERSVVSQRETGRESSAMALAVREALREDPDVLVIEDVASMEVAAAALQAVHAGRLIVVSVSASSPVHAITALIDMFPEDERARMQASLATELRAVISQTLVRNATGGRTPAREVLFNTPAVSALVREGRISEVRSSADGEGHVTLDASLAALVRDGAVHVAEACRKASDRAAFVRLLQRDGIDTAFAEKLA